MNESQYAQQAPSDSDFHATARMVLDIHRDDNGFCLGCYVYFYQLKPFPCEYYSWAARVIATYPRAAPSAGRAPVRNRQPVPSLQLAQPATASACDDTVVIRRQ
ncbi:hypothetical protein ABZ671_17330 [Micromonospora sp. NPDC006766]|uniref:hypothetical protein n=1 Tax=Micromonospora sp. NPDC006766 TaxID=3154778 RepID=UPI0033C42924